MDMTNGPINGVSRSGGARPGDLRPGPRSTATSTATSASSAAGSPDCGRPTGSRTTTRRSTSSCWRRSSPGSVRPVATGAGCRPSSPASKELYGRTHGRAGVEALVTAMEHAVDDVIGICRDEGVDADIVKSGVLYVARSPAQLVRMREGLADDARWGVGESHQRELDATETARGSGSRVRSARCSPRTRRGCSRPGWWRASPRRWSVVASGSSSARASRGSIPARRRPPAGRCARRWCCGASRDTRRASTASAAPGCR